MKAQGEPAVHEALVISAPPAAVYHHAMAAGECAPFLPAWLHVQREGPDVTVVARMGPIAKRWHAQLAEADAPGRITWRAIGHEGEALLQPAEGEATRLEVRIWSDAPWPPATLTQLRRGLAAFAAHVEQRGQRSFVHEGAHSH